MPFADRTLTEIACHARGRAKNRGVMDRLFAKIGQKKMTTEYDTRIAGALGAALFGYALSRKQRAKNK